PASALRAEDAFPVDVARAEVRRRRVRAIGAAEGRANTEAAFREVEPVPHVAPDAVVRDPSQMRRLYSALEHEVLDQPADRIVGERGHNRGPLAEAAPQRPRDVVLAAAL